MLQFFASEPVPGLFLCATVDVQRTSGGHSCISEYLTPGQSCISDRSCHLWLPPVKRYEQAVFLVQDQAFHTRDACLSCKTREFCCEFICHFGANLIGILGIVCIFFCEEQNSGNDQRHHLALVAQWSVFLQSTNQEKELFSPEVCRREEGTYRK